jgi:hypothetical protein
MLRKHRLLRCIIHARQLVSCKWVYTIKQDWKGNNVRAESQVSGYRVLAACDRRSCCTGEKDSTRRCSVMWWLQRSCLEAVRCAVCFPQERQAGKSGVVDAAATIRAANCIHASHNK